MKLTWTEALALMENGKFIAHAGFPNSFFYIVNPAEWDTFQNRSARYRRIPFIVAVDLVNKAIAPFWIQATDIAFRCPTDWKEFLEK